MKGVLTALGAVLLLAGCSAIPEAKELGQAAVIRAVGADAKDGGAAVCAVAGGAEDMDGEVLYASGSSVATAALGAQEQGDRAVWYGHVGQLVLGEELARAGVASLADYLAREPQLGPGVELWVAEGEAGRVLAVPGVVGRLEHLGEDAGRKVSCSAAALMSALAGRGSVCVPALALEADGEALRVVPTGYALLRQGKLVDWLRGERAAGYELLAGRGLGESVGVTVGDAGTVSVMLEENVLCVQPQFRDGELTDLEVRCTLRGRVIQQERLLSETEREELVLLYERLQAERLVAALELLQYWDADPARLERLAMLERPSHKMQIARQFAENYRALAIRVAVTAQIDTDGVGPR